MTFVETTVGELEQVVEDKGGRGVEVGQEAAVGLGEGCLLGYCFRAGVLGEEVVAVVLVLGGFITTQWF